MSEKYDVNLSIKAKDDLKRIVLYIKNELNEPNIARKYATIIKNEIKTLDYLPQKFAIIDDYIVFYRVNEDKK